MEVFGWLTTLFRLIFCYFVPGAPQKPTKVRLDVTYSCIADAVDLEWRGQVLELWSVASEAKGWLLEQVFRYRRTLVIKAGSQKFTGLPSNTTLFAVFSVDARTGLVKSKVSSTPDPLTYPYLEPFAFATTRQGSGGGGGIAEASVEWL